MASCDTVPRRHSQMFSQFNMNLIGDPIHPTRVTSHSVPRGPFHSRQRSQASIQCVDRPHRSVSQCSSSRRHSSLMFAPSNYRHSIKPPLSRSIPSSLHSRQNTTNLSSTLSLSASSIPSLPCDDVMIWEFLEDISSALWTRYSVDICCKLTEAINSGARKCQVVDVEAAGLSKSKATNSKQQSLCLEMDFGSMMETNLVTGWRRKMRVRVVDSASNGLKPLKPLNALDTLNAMNAMNTVNGSKALNQEVTAPPPFEIGSIPSIPTTRSIPTEHHHHHQRRRRQQWQWQWEWHSDKRGWTAYHNKLCRKMESAFAEGLSRYVFKIRSTRTQYELDFEAMTQRNLETLKMRAIRRRARLPSRCDPESVHQSVHESISMSPHHRVSMLSPSSMVSPTPSETPMADTLDLPPPPPPPPPLTVPALKGRTSMNGDVLNTLNLQQTLRRERRLSTMQSDGVNHNATTRFVWEFQSGDGRWHRYGDGVSLQFESVFQSEAVTARLKIGGVEFEVAVREQPMVQINCVTGSRAEIRRVAVGRHRGTMSMSMMGIPIPMVMDREREHTLKSVDGPKASRTRLHRKRASMMCLPSSTASRRRKKKKKKEIKRRHRVE